MLCVDRGRVKMEADASDVIHLLVDRLHPRRNRNSDFNPKHLTSICMDHLAGYMSPIGAIHVHH